MQQKPEGEKYSRVTITLPPGLYQEAKSRCNDTGLSLSTVIGDLLNVWMKGETPPPIHTSIHQYTPVDTSRLNELERQIKTISDKIESPIHTDTYQYAQDITDIRARLEALEQVPLIATKAKENQVKSGGAVPQISAEPIETRKELAKVAGVSHDTIAPDRVTLTDEMRSQIIHQVELLQGGGMSYSQIAGHLGIGKGRITELKQGKLKTISRHQIDTLMSLQSQNHSREGT